MYEELIAVLVERIKQGQTHAALWPEVQAAGYSEEEFAAHFAAAQSRVTQAAGMAPLPTAPASAAATPSAPPSQPTQVSGAAFAPEPSHTLQATATPAPTQPPPVAQPQLSHAVPQTARTGLIVGLIAVFLILGGTIAAAMTGVLNLGISNPFSSAPYAEETILSEIVAGFQKIERSGYAVNLTVESVDKDRDTYLLPDEFLINDYDELSAALVYIPEDMKLQGSVSGNFDIENPREPSGYVQLAGSYETDSFTAKADVEAMVVHNEGAFLKVNAMPSLFFFDFSSIKGEWVQLADSSLSEDIIDDVQDELQDMEIDDLYESLFALAQEHQVFTVAAGPTKESLESGVAYKYTLALNHVNLEAFFEDVIREYGRSEGASNREIEEAIEELKEEFNFTDAGYLSPAFVEYVNKHYNLVIWARGDGVPVKIGMEARLPVDIDVLVQQEAQQEDRARESQVQRMVSGFNMSYSWYGEEDEIETVPNEDFCDSDTVARNLQSYRIWGYDEDLNIACTATEDAYGVSVELSTTEYCVDSEGFAERDARIGQDGTCESFTPEPVETEPREAERQVNASLYLEFTDINNAKNITAPSDFLTPEEVMERNPMLGEMLLSLERFEPAFAITSLPQVLGAYDSRDDESGISDASAVLMEEEVLDLIPELENSTETDGEFTRMVQ